MLKAAVIGPAGCGKTALLRSICPEYTRHFKCLGPTLVPSCPNALLGIETEADPALGKSIVHLEIWDCSGDKALFDVGAAFLNGVQLCVLVLDVSNPSCMYETEQTLAKFNLLCLMPEYDDKAMQASVVVMGTKCDLPSRPVEYERAERWANRLGYEYFECASVGEFEDEMHLQDAEQMCTWSRAIGECFSHGASKALKDGHALRALPNGRNRCRIKPDRAFALQRQRSSMHHPGVLDLPGKDSRLAGEYNSEESTSSQESESSCTIN